MPGIRVDVELLSSCARQVRVAGEDIAAVADRDVHVDPAAFGRLGPGVAEAYARLCTTLLTRRDRTAEALTDAGDELRAVVGSCTAGDESSAAGLLGQER